MSEPILRFLEHAIESVDRLADGLRQLATDLSVPEPPTPEPPPAPEPPVPQPSSKSQFGFNVSHLENWSPCRPFVNEWPRAAVSQEKDKPKLQWGPNGELISAVPVKTWWDGVHTPPGDYTLKVTRPDGTLDISTVTLTGGIKELPLTGPWQSVSLRTKDVQGATTVSFGHRARVTGCIRWMDPLLTNEGSYDPASPAVVDVTNAGTQWQRYLQRVPISYITGVHHVFQCPCWLNIHVKETPERVRQIAEEFRSIDCKVYVETGNEIWNPAFFGLRYYSPSGGTGWLEPYAQAAATNARIFKDVLGQDRVVGVIGGQAANSWLANRLLTLTDLDVINAVAIAPYFGGPPVRKLTSTEARSIGQEQIIQLAANHMRGDVRNWISGHAVVAQEHGVQLVGYEGGSHLRRDVTAEEAPFIAASQSEAMGDLYDEYLQMWRDTTDGVLCVYADVQQDCWGHLQEEGGQSPRWRTVTQYMTSDL